MKTASGTESVAISMKIQFQTSFIEFVRVKVKEKI